MFAGQLDEKLKPLQSALKALSAFFNFEYNLKKFCAHEQTTYSNCAFGSQNHLLHNKVLSTPLQQNETK